MYVFQCYQVVDFCKFRRETVEIAMSYVDRYLCTPKGKSALVNRKEYQLVAMTALYVAIKLHEPMEMETSLLADLSRGCYEEMQFVEMEQTILQVSFATTVCCFSIGWIDSTDSDSVFLCHQTIHWRVNGPTCVSFVGHFLALLPSAIHRSVAESIMEYARFQIELAIAEQAFVFLKPSHVALAAVMNAVEGMDPELFPHKTQSKFVRYIERYSELNVSSVEKIQGKLSMIMSKFLVEDWEEIEQQLAVQGDGNTEGDSKLRRSLKTSPVSVIGT